MSIVKADVRVEFEDGHYLFRLTPVQCRLFRVALRHSEDGAGGDIGSMVRTGAVRADLTRLREKFSVYDVRLSVEEMHVLFSSLAALVFGSQSERTFNARTGFYREQAIMLGNALVRLRGVRGCREG